MILALLFSVVIALLALFAVTVYWPECGKQKARADSLADDLNSARVEIRQILGLYEEEKQKAAQYSDLARNAMLKADTWRENWSSLQGHLAGLLQRQSALADIRSQAESLFCALDDVCEPAPGPTTTETDA